MAKGQKSGTPLVKLLYASRGNFLERCFIRYKGFLNLQRQIGLMQNYPKISGKLILRLRIYNQNNYSVIIYFNLFK